MSLLISLMVVAPVAAGMVRGGGSNINDNLHRAFTLARSEHHIVQLERRAQFSSGGLKFASDCASFLLSSDSIEDGIISQDEFTSFLSESCRSDGFCGASEEYEFERLSFDLQLRFVRGVCPFDDIGARIECIEGLEAMWLDGGLFGFRVSEDGHESLVESVESMCTEAYVDAIKMGLTGTPVPTSNPSMIETTKPSNAATTSPKPSPTSNPSMIETTKPSNAATTELPSPKPSSSVSTVSTPIPTSISALYTPPPSSNEDYEATESPLPLLTNRPTLRPNLFKEPTNFVEECHQMFVGDGVVSQVNFTRFVANRCRAEGLCDDEFKLSFEQLDISLQLDFILAACGEDMKDCTDEFGHFGFDAGAESIETSVGVLCSSAFEYAISMGLATTSAPTPMPTNKPTMNTASEMPSSNPSYRHHGVLFAPTEKKPLGPNKKAFIGVSAAAVLLLMTAGGAVAYARSNSFDKKSLPDGRNSNGANNYVPWERHSPFPFSVPSSCSSSSSSFRDCRFVRVTGPGGQPIAQFDPNTASAVVIGSVTIGNGGSSSISTGPSKEYITIGQVGPSKQRAKSDASSSELSSVSSERSTAAKNGYRLGWYGSSSSKAASRDLSDSTMSRCTMPMTQARTAQFERIHYDNTISFVDWKAASHVISEYRDPTSITDAAAAQRQRQFFFDIYMKSVLSSSSGSNQVSTHSLGVGGRYESELNHVAIHSGEALVSSPGEVQELLVPWRRGGFSGAFRTSDGKHSEESESSRSFYIEHWARQNLPERSPAHQNPVRSLFKRAKVMMQSLFKHKQYQNLNGRLHEDLSVISMQSYSSSNMNIQLLPNPRSSEAFGLPGLILGTWAAATIPIEAVKRSPATGSLENNDVEAAHDTTDCGVPEAQSKKEQMTTSSNAPLGRSAILGIQRRDIDSGSSGLESSTGWSTSSIRHGSFISSCSSTTWDNENNTSQGVRVMDLSQAISEDDSPLHQLPVIHDRESSLSSKAERVKLVSPRCASLNITPDSNETNAVLRSMSAGLVNQDDEPPPSNPKAHDSNFFMMLANDIHADASSVEHSTPRFSGDWSHNVSESTESSESASIETDDNDRHSLSLSLESGAADSASQALEWAIAQEVSKKINPSCSTIISIPKE